MTYIVKVFYDDENVRYVYTDSAQLLSDIVWCIVDNDKCTAIVIDKEGK